MAALVSLVSFWHMKYSTVGTMVICIQGSDLSYVIWHINQTYSVTSTQTVTGTVFIAENQLIYGTVCSLNIHRVFVFLNILYLKLKYANGFIVLICK